MSLDVEFYTALALALCSPRALLEGGDAISKEMERIEAELENAARA